MLKVRVKDVPRFLSLAYRQRKPVFLWGKPGIGKSQAVKDTARLLGVSCNDHVRLSQLDPLDLGGLPVVRDGRMDRVYPSWLPTSGEGILFLDEMNKGSPSTQAAAFQLVLDRKLGEAELGAGWMVVAAGNRSTDRAVVYDLDAPLQNRFPLHIEVEQPTEEELIEYFTSIGKVQSHVFGFLRFKPSRVWYREERSVDPAWASPRSWEFLIDLFSDAELSGLSKDARLSLCKDLAVGAVGDVVGRELLGYMRLSEEVNIQDILSDPSLFLSIERPDVRHSVITEVADRYARDVKLERKVVDLVFVCAAQPELVMLCLEMFSRVQKGFVRKVLADARADALAQHMEKFL